MVAVVAYHVWPESVPGGWVGVSVFFTLSGFLITTLLIDERSATGTVSLSGFWARRARRLLPAVITSVMASLILVAAIDPAALHDAAISGAAGLAYVANWVAAGRPGGYEAIFTDPGPFDHLWSLAVEEQVYVALPILFVAAADCRKRALWIGLVSVATIVVATVAWWGDPDSYYATPVRAAEVAAGAAAAFGASVVRSRGFPRLVRFASAFDLAAAAGAVAVLGWVTFTWTEHDPIVFEGGPLLVSLASVAALVVAIRRPGPLTLPALRWLGTRSYAIYLWHWPMIVLFDMPATLTLSITAVVAETSMRLVESPVRRRTGWGTRIRNPLPTLGGAAAGAALLALGVSTMVAAPKTIFDINAPVVPIWYTGSRQTAGPAATGSASAAQSRVPEAPPATTTIRPTVVMVVGDSTALAAFDGLRAWGDREHRAVIIDGSQEGCGPLQDPLYGVSYTRQGLGLFGVDLGDGRAPCRRTIPQLAADAGGVVPDEVIIFDWGAVMNDGVDPASPGDPAADFKLTDPATQDMLTAIYQTRIDEATALGADVLLTTAPIPAAWAFIGNNAALAEVTNNAEAYNRVVTELAAGNSNVHVVATARAFSGADDRYPRTDGIHIDPGVTSERFADDWLVRPILDHGSA